MLSSTLYKSAIFLIGQLYPEYTVNLLVRQINSLKYKIIYLWLSWLNFDYIGQKLFLVLWVRETRVVTLAVTKSETPSWNTDDVLVRMTSVKWSSIQMFPDAWVQSHLINFAENFLIQCKISETDYRTVYHEVTQLWTLNIMVFILLNNTATVNRFKTGLLD